MSKKESEKALKEAVEELSAAREAARLKVHLLSMDARKAWDDLEGKFQDLRGQLEDTGEQVAETSAVAARDLARTIRKFVDRHA